MEGDGHLARHPALPRPMTLLGWSPCVPGDPQLQPQPHLFPIRIWQGLLLTVLSLLCLPWARRERIRKTVWPLVPLPRPLPRRSPAVLTRNTGSVCWPHATLRLPRDPGHGGHWTHCCRRGEDTCAAHHLVCLPDHHPTKAQRPRNHAAGGANATSGTSPMWVLVDKDNVAPTAEAPRPMFP